MQHIMIVICLLCIMHMVEGFHPFSCCDLHNGKGPSEFREVVKILFYIPETCKYRNVAYLYKTMPNNSNVTHVSCANGFNLMSFLLAVIDRVSLRTNKFDSSLTAALLQYKKVYSQEFSIENTNTSIFKVDTRHSRKQWTTG